MLDFIELGLNTKHKWHIYISGTNKKQTTMHSGRETKPLMLFFNLLMRSDPVKQNRQQPLLYYHNHVSPW